jgi:hypothetical protein
MAEDSNQPEQPRVEPEIIPPDRPRRQSDWRQSNWPPRWRPYQFGQARQTHRIYVTRLGPFGCALLFLVLAILAAAIFLAILGAVLLWVPVVALLVVVAAIFRLFRR